MTLLEKLRCLFTFGQGVALPLPDISSQTNPIQLFDLWFNDAKKSGVLLPEAMSVSSCDKSGPPSSRMVLLKEFDDDMEVHHEIENHILFKKASEIEKAL